MTGFEPRTSGTNWATTTAQQNYCWVELLFNSAIQQTIDVLSNIAIIS